MDRTIDGPIDRWTEILNFEFLILDFELVFGAKSIKKLMTNFFPKNRDCEHLAARLKTIKKAGKTEYRDGERFRARPFPTAERVILNGGNVAERS